MLNRENLLAFMQEESYKPLSYKELMNVFAVRDSEDELKFSKILGRLEKDGEIIKTRKNKYGLPERMNLFRGIIHLNQRGYGILKPDEPGLPEIFVYGKKLNGAMHDDRVMVRIQEKGNDGLRPEGTVIRILNRANKELVGTFKQGKHLLQVIPDDSRQIYPVYVKRSRKYKVKSGDKVVVKITSWPEKDRAPEGKIMEILGKKGSPGLDLKVIVKKHGLKTVFGEAVVEEARAVARPLSEEELSQRRDLRNLRMVTIDGEDAKDLDDAVSISKKGSIYQLGVHIADVSHYVAEDSKLDKEAFERGTSVYLIDKVLPMLPVELSNDICSLNPNADRLTISCIMDIDENGNLIDYEICKSVININERMTYTNVNAILAGDNPDLEKRYQELRDDFFLMKELADILRKGREKRGSLDFDFPESKVIVDENSFPIEVKKLERGDSEKIIEDFMIQANEVVAEHMYKKQLPALYRVHQKPEGESLDRLNQILAVFGHKISEKKLSPGIFQKILRDIKGKPEEQMISMLMLRSMKHAEYLPEALGHFGLASEYYCHFTSPIRRYPDLLIHRVLTAFLEKRMRGKKRQSMEKKMPLYGQQSTLQEMKAEEAERELLDIKKAQYMEQFLGEEFNGSISSVQSFGFFVELGNTVEGLVHISTIADDYYEFNDRNYTLVGNHTGRKFSIGDEVRIQLVKVNVEEAKIDFELID